MSEIPVTTDDLLKIIGQQHVELLMLRAYVAQLQKEGQSCNERSTPRSPRRAERGRTDGPYEGRYLHGDEGAQSRPEAV